MEPLRCGFRRSRLLVAVARAAAGRERAAGEADQDLNLQLLLGSRVYYIAHVLDLLVLESRVQATGRKQLTTSYSLVASCKLWRLVASWAEIRRTQQTLRTRRHPAHRRLCQSNRYGTARPRPLLVLQRAQCVAPESRAPHRGWMPTRLPLLRRAGAHRGVTKPFLQTVGRYWQALGSPEASPNDLHQSRRPDLQGRWGLAVMTTAGAPDDSESGTRRRYLRLVLERHRAGARRGRRHRRHQGPQLQGAHPQSPAPRNAPLLG